MPISVEGCVQHSSIHTDIKMVISALSLLSRILTIALPGPGVIKLEFILRLKIKRNDWLLADTCPQAANHCALFVV